MTSRIMLMQDARRWIKAGIEYNDGAPAIGSVLTQEHQTGQPVFSRATPVSSGCV